MESFVADTMAIILWMEKRKLPQKVKRIFSRSENRELKIYMPAIALAEIGYLSERKRIDTSIEDVEEYLATHPFVIHPMDMAVVKKAFEIDDIPELHDRLIAATGSVTDCMIITNDPKIQSSKFIVTVWE